MGKLIIEGLSAETMAELERRAAANGRSLEEEAADILQSAATPADNIVAQRKAALKWMREHVKGGEGPPYSVDLIREDRDR